MPTPAKAELILRNLFLVSTFVQESKALDHPPLLSQAIAGSWVQVEHRPHGIPALPRSRHWVSLLKCKLRLFFCCHFSIAWRMLVSIFIALVCWQLILIVGSIWNVFSSSFLLKNLFSVCRIQRWLFFFQELEGAINCLFAPIVYGQNCYGCPLVL